MQIDTCSPFVCPTSGFSSQQSTTRLDRGLMAVFGRRKWPNCFSLPNVPPKGITPLTRQRVAERVVPVNDRVRSATGPDSFVQLLHLVQRRSDRFPSSTEANP